MKHQNIGLTTIYNHFHDPYNNDYEIAQLRESHENMDHAVLDAYGWTDLQIKCEFILDYVSEDESSKRKKPWRYRWADNLQNEILGRLIHLNVKRSSQSTNRSARYPIP